MEGNGAEQPVTRDYPTKVTEDGHRKLSPAGLVCRHKIWLHGQPHGIADASKPLSIKGYSGYGFPCIKPDTISCGIPEEGNNPL
jgi:hypothetical protein